MAFESLLINKIKSSNNVSSKKTAQLLTFVNGNHSLIQTQQIYYNTNLKIF